jgi:undecaprenyl pyrophosphate synthase
MSWRIGYAELYFTAKKCPEFEVVDYEEALKRFDNMANLRNF